MKWLMARSWFSHPSTLLMNDWQGVHTKCPRVLWARGASVTERQLSVSKKAQTCHLTLTKDRCLRYRVMHANYQAFVWRRFLDKMLLHQVLTNMAGTLAMENCLSTTWTNRLPQRYSCICRIYRPPSGSEMSLPETCDVMHGCMCL